MERATGDSNGHCSGIQPIVRGSRELAHWLWVWGLLVAGCAGEASAAAARSVDILPAPKQVQIGSGRLQLVGGDPKQPRSTIVAGPEAGYASEAIAARLGAPIVAAPRPGSVAITLKIDANLEFARKLSGDARPEAYRLVADDRGVEVAAVESEGLLRGAATLLQILEFEQAGVYVPHLTVVDWPNFRYRCASDWLMNAEVNRWAYDWGDGDRACLARIKRKLDLCFAYKINQVWFDGFGWNLDRRPGYAALVRECSQYARRRGVRLSFAGYGGGYGTAYQQSEIYRCGYFGTTFRNRRPLPDGEEYSCRGMHGSQPSRRYGTCLSNPGLAAAKLDEMKRFVAAVEPGFLYIHDIDTGSLAESQQSWLLRCERCRAEWPSDKLADARGQAGALAAWYRQIRETLDGVSGASGYRAGRDLALIFISPLYTVYYEKGPRDLWQQESDYFCLLSRLMGPAANCQLGLREQFYRPDGGKKIAGLREAMDRSGGRAALHVIAFGGGDHYLSDDLVNVSGSMAHFYEGAESVCLSNGGVHEEPVQLLNAEWLWAGSTGGYREEPRDEAAAVALFQRISRGKHRPRALFAPGGPLERICRRLWGEAAGGEMYRAYLAGGDSGEGPVSRVWWAVTADVARLKANSASPDWKARYAHWLRRKAVTEEALFHARRAGALAEDEDVRWFASCLELGAGFSECMALAVSVRLGDDPAARARLKETLAALESKIAALGRGQRTDALGGDPGCWLETIEQLRKIHGLD